MARRVYYLKSKKSELKQALMKNYRAARSNIDPELLENIRHIITSSMIENEAQFKNIKNEKSQLKIDKRKNLQTIQKLLELTSDQSEYQKKIKKILVDILH